MCQPYTSISEESVSVCVIYSITSSPAQTVGSIIGNQAINLYGVSEASTEREYIIEKELGPKF